MYGICAFKRKSVLLIFIHKSAFQMGMQCFQPGKVATKKVQTVKKEERPALENANVIEERPGVFVWAHGSGDKPLTPAQLEFIRRETGCKSLNVVRIQAIKAMMRTKTCAQIVAHFRGRKGYKERTIKRYHAALSKCGGVVK